MEPYNNNNNSGACSSSNSSSSSCATAKLASDLDGLLAGAGYAVRSSDLRHVAQRLQHLETAMVGAPLNDFFSESAVHYNPADISSWVDSMLSEFNQPLSAVSSDPGSYVSDVDNGALFPILHDWNTHQITTTTAAVADVEEDSGIRLVHLLMACGEAVHVGDVALAGTLLQEMKKLLGRVNTGSGIGKVAGCFIQALTRRLYAPPAACAATAVENEILYHHFYEACPYLKFAHFTANQAILEAFDGHDCVHVIDFNLMHGLQWPALIQALALRPGGPPFLRITGIGPPSSDGRDGLRDIGLKLAEVAWSVNVRFAFRGVAASRLDDVKPWMLQVNPAEAVAVNSILQLHRLLGSETTHPHVSPIDTVLSWIRSLNPKIVTVVEQEANHNQPEFIDRFTDALYYYSTMFDSLEACGLEPEKTVAEMYVEKEVCNVVCCEGWSRVERHEPLDRWKERLGGAGFSRLHLGSNAFKQASMLLTLFSAQGYCVEEKDGCLTLGWHNRPLISASAWRPLGSPFVSIDNNILL